LAKRGAAPLDLESSSDFALPDPKRPKLTHPHPQAQQTPLRDQMNLNVDEGAREDTVWEKSSLASGYTTNSMFPLKAVDIKSSLSMLPQPKHKYEVSDAQIAQMEEDIKMTEDQLEE